MNHHAAGGDGAGRQLLRGAAAGTVATLPMSGVMLLAGRLGLMGRQPPKKITEASLEAADAPVEDEDTRNVLASIAHLGFGAGMGMLFAVLHRRFRPPGPAAAHGMAFGLAVWAGSYKGWVPALGILPPPEHDRPGRVRTMVLAHLVFGAVLAALDTRWRRHWSAKAARGGCYSGRTTRTWLSW